MSKIMASINKLKVPRSSKPPEVTESSKEDEILERTRLLTVFNSFLHFFELLPNFDESIFKARLSLPQCEPIKLAFAEKFERLIHTIDEADEDILAEFNRTLQNRGPSSKEHLAHVSSSLRRRTASNSRQAAIEGALSYLESILGQIMGLR